MITTLNIDIETYSSVDIKESGMYKYVQSPDFDILLFAYSINGQEVKIIDLASGEKIPQEIVLALKDNKVIKYAYNASFEWYCLSKFYQTSLVSWRCTMIHALYCGYTAGLGPTAIALGLPQDKQKDTQGKALIKLFCISGKDGKRVLPKQEPEKWKLFKKYCIQDVVVEMAIATILANFQVPESEWQLWQLDQQINAYGVAVDLDLVVGAMNMFDIIKNGLTKEAIKITGLNNPNSQPQLVNWLNSNGVNVDDVKKATVSDLLADDSINVEIKKVLEIRQQTSKTSVKKYETIINTVCSDGYVRGLLRFYGANRTGRWAGSFVQPQNLPRNYIDTLNLARKLVKNQKLEAMQIIYSDVVDILSQLIRTSFIPSVGNKLIIADFSAIEARVIAWLANEQWRLDVFNTHGKIYEASASQMFGVPIELISKGNKEYELRQKGKVAELALGYGGGPGALISMGALRMGLTEEELPDIVSRWRSTNKRIRDLWYGLDNAVISVMQTGRPVGVNNLLIAREFDIGNGLDFLTIKLSSGRKLYYAKPFIGPGKYGDALYYYGMNQTTKKWGQIDTYGGKLTENVVQAIARDCLAVSLARLANAGYQTVMHIHDEVVLDVPQNVKLEDVIDLMIKPIPWAPGLPLGADGFETEYYKKD